MMKKPYVLFAYNSYYPSGGMTDLYKVNGKVVKFETIDEAINVGRNYDYYEVVKIRTLELVYSNSHIGAL